MCKMNWLRSFFFELITKDRSEISEQSFKLASIRLFISNQNS